MNIAPTQSPDGHPGFTKPPLDEVVMGVQFEDVPGYRSIDAMQVSELFQSEYPKVEERQTLLPQFEVFHGAGAPPGKAPTSGKSPPGCRLWLVSEDGARILQFQPDRFIANWRLGREGPPYPGFQTVMDGFMANLRKLAGHLKDGFDHPISINQVEITYLNLLPVESFSEVREWVRPWNGGFPNVGSLHLAFNEQVDDGDGRPFARLHHDLQSVYLPGGKAFRLGLAYRGKPARDDIDAALGFMRDGRKMIVSRFCQITTDQAHHAWRK